MHVHVSRTEFIPSAALVYRRRSNLVRYTGLLRDTDLRKACRIFNHNKKNRMFNSLHVRTSTITTTRNESVAVDNVINLPWPWTFHACFHPLVLDDGGVHVCP